MPQRHSDTFEPILLEGLTATLFGAEIAEEGLNVVCKSLMALPEYHKDFGSVSAATLNADNEDTNLEVGTMELAQYRMRIQDDMTLRLKNPSSVQQWRTMRTNFFLPQFPTEPSQEWLQTYLWKASEFFVFENETPRFDFLSTFASDTSRVLFSGWKFKLQKLPGGTKGRIEIWVNSWPSSSGTP